MKHMDLTQIRKYNRLILLAVSAVCLFSACGKKGQDTQPETETSVVSEETESEEENAKVEEARKTGKTTIVVDDQSGKPGQEVDVQVYLVNNPGILGTSLTLSYDTDVLQLVDVENGAAFEDILEFSSSKELGNGSVFMWDGESISEDEVKDGTIMTLTFEILEDAGAGKTPIILTDDVDGTVDNDIEPVELTVDNGYLTVEE